MIHASYNEGERPVWLIAGRDLGIFVEVKDDGPPLVTESGRFYSHMAFDKVRWYAAAFPGRLEFAVFKPYEFFWRCASVSGSVLDYSKIHSFLAVSLKSLKPFAKDNNYYHNGVHEIRGLGDFSYGTMGWISDVCADLIGLKDS